MATALNLINQHIALIEVIALSLILGVISNYVLHKIIRRYYHHSTETPFSIAISALQRAFYFVFPLLYLSLFISMVSINQSFQYLGVLIRIIVTLTLLAPAMRLLDYIDIWLYKKQNSSDHATSIGILVTRAYLLKKILRITFILLALALILLNFPAIREFGKGILISAGVIGGILALAAQKIFSDFFTGMDFILNKPIKVGDIVTIGSEMGSIEKIKLNQICLRTWDLRLIVYPLKYFIDNPFQNLSLAEQGLQGIVYFFVDYNAEVEKIRQALTDILYKSPLWNQKTNYLQVTEANEFTIQLRAVVSARNSSDLWNLRCYVREKLIDFIQKNHPEILPKEKIQLNRKPDIVRKSALFS